MPRVFVLLIKHLLKEFCFRGFADSQTVQFVCNGNIITGEFLDFAVGPDQLPGFNTIDSRAAERMTIHHVNH